MSRATDLAWAAGIIDGEGTITLVNNGNTYVVGRVLVTMTDQFTIRHLHSIFPEGSVRRENFTNSPNHKFRWTFQIDARKACRLLTMVERYLVTKKAQANVVLDYYQNSVQKLGTNRLTNAVKRSRMVYVRRIRKLNKRGV